MIEAFKDQQEQLRRLLERPVWVSDAPKAMLTELDAQVAQTKDLLSQLGQIIREQMERRLVLLAIDPL